MRKIEKKRIRANLPGGPKPLAPAQNPFPFPSPPSAQLSSVAARLNAVCLPLSRAGRTRITGRSGQSLRSAFLLTTCATIARLLWGRSCQPGPLSLFARGRIADHWDRCVSSFFFADRRNRIPYAPPSCRSSQRADSLHASQQRSAVFA